MKKRRRGFSLSEALIALALVGVIASLYIPSIVANAKQKEYKTSFKKAVNVINNAISLNMVLDNDTPHHNGNLFGYLQKHMFIYKSTTQLSFASHNYAFYTTDGMRYEFPTQKSDMHYLRLKLHESFEDIDWNNYNSPRRKALDTIGYCGSKGLPLAAEDMFDYPCLIMVDVNGDRKPNPAVIKENVVTINDYVYAMPDEKLFKDVFSIMITQDRAVPYGVVSQRAMYEKDKNRY